MAYPALKNLAAVAVTFFKRRTSVEQGFDCVEFSSLGAAGVTLSTATSLIHKQKLPADKSKGVVNQVLTCVIPFAPRADGSRRFAFVSIKVDTPADTIAAELIQVKNNCIDMTADANFATLVEGRALNLS